MGVLNIVQNAVQDSLYDAFDTIQYEAEHRVHRIVDKVQHKIRNTIISVGMFVIGIGMLSLSAVFFLSEYLQLSKTLSFLTIAIIFFIIGGVMKALR